MSWWQLMVLNKVEGEMVGVSTTGKYKGPRHMTMLREVGGGIY